MSMIWVTSDLHFGHEKEFLYGPRGYSSNQEMMADIVQRWNQKIGDDDIVLVLGDLVIGENEEEGFDMLQQLKGRLYVVVGNHDTDNRIEAYRHCHNIASVQMAMRFRYKGYSFFATHYPTLTSNKEKSLKKSVINLCGHRHVSDPFYDWDKGYIYHVELDAHNNEPILLDDIIKNIKLKIDSEQKMW